MYVRGMGDATTGPGSACNLFDNVWASQGCLDWYAQNDPTNPFYVLNTKGLIVGGSGVLGSTASQAVAAFGNNALGLDPTSGAPAWLWMAGIAALGLYLVPKLVAR
jgi:hypothetical protein